jgi:hypothetical protein
VTTNIRLSIEFIADNYEGTIIPTCSNNQLFWNNSGSIVVTNPLNQNVWGNSRHIARSTGVAYTNLVDYLHSSVDNFKIYQPVNIVYTSTGNIYNFSNYFSYQETQYGKTVIAATESYGFINEVFNQLQTFGCDLTCFLQVRMFLNY